MVAKVIGATHDDTDLRERGTTMIDRTTLDLRLAAHYDTTAARLRRSGRAVARSFMFGVLPPRLAPAVRARVAREVVAG